MKPELLCMGCMADTNAAAVCSYCNYAYDTPADSSVQLTPRTIVDGRYLLGRVLGQGGFGITYLAYDLQLDRKLAIKEYFPSAISTRAYDRLTVTPIIKRYREDLDYGLQKFYEEGQALLRFKDHPNVVAMIEFFHANGTGYIVMLYIEGKTFKEYLRDAGGRVSFADALHRLTPVMHALEDLHAVKVLHRDVSPDNIYLEGGGGVRLLDFGATRNALGEQSLSLSVVLKPGYAPEEQYRSRGVQGPPVDIYALGATFYRAITGQVPPDSMDRLQKDDLAAPGSLGVDIPPMSESALLKALSVKAEGRFQTIAELRTGITPEEISRPPERSRRSALLFLPVFLVLATIVGIASVTPNSGALAFFSQVLLFGWTLALLLWMWKPIQDGVTPTSPKRAAGLMLMPFFNFFWVFPAVAGFAKQYNLFVERHSLPLKPLSAPLFRLLATSYVLFWLASMTFSPSLIVTCLALHICLVLAGGLRVCDRVDALAQLNRAKFHNAQVVVKPEARAKQVNPARMSLRCAAGDYEGQEIEIGSEDLVIGRSPNGAHLVLSSVDVSAKHVRVWSDPGSSGVWVEDMDSTNGTFFRQATSGDNAWSKLKGRKLLARGDRFRLSGDAAEFEVMAA